MENTYGHKYEAHWPNLSKLEKYSLVPGLDLNFKAFWVVFQPSWASMQPQPQDCFVCVKAGDLSAKVVHEQFLCRRMKLQAVYCLLQRMQLKTVDSNGF